MYGMPLRDVENDDLDAMQSEDLRRIIQSRSEIYYQLPARELVIDSPILS